MKLKWNLISVMLIIIVVVFVFVTKQVNTINVAEVETVQEQISQNLEQNIVEQETEMQQIDRLQIDEETIDLPNEKTQVEINPQIFTMQQNFFDGEMPTPVSCELAKQIALSNAEYDVNNVTFIKAKQEYEDEIVKWNIIFAANGNKYDYDINAIDGSVAGLSVKTIAYNQVPYLAPAKMKFANFDVSGTPASTINLDTAMDIAVNNAGFNIANVAFTKAEYNFNNDMPRWETEFVIDNHKYEYVINAIDSSIISACVK